MIEVILLDQGRVDAPRRFDDATVRIGRHPTNHVVLGARHVSARHGELVVSAGGAVIYRDLGTPNGSYVRRGDALIGVDAEHGYELELEEGDELFFGDPDFVTGLRVSLLTRRVTAHGSAPAFSLEVLSRLDISDESKLQGLAAAFDRSVLLALQQHIARTARSQHLPTILRSFADAVLDFCPKATHVSVYLREDGGDEPGLALAHARGDVGEPTPVSSTVWSAVRERREAFTFEASDPTFNAAESLKRSAVRIGMVVPLWTGDSLTGLVQVDGRGERRAPFDPRDLEALAVFASQLSVSVENARLHNELEHTVARLRRAQSEMQRLAFRDPVTGLSNRRLFQDRLAQAVRLARRQRRKVALLYVDLDEFKHVNDSFGHDAGDALLKHVAGRLSACLREQDTVARVGGDEFAAILCDVADQDAARVVARKMLDALREPVDLCDHAVTTSASIGITLSPDDGADVSRLLRNADLAMYRAKSRGRDTFQFFTEDMNRETSQRLALEGELREALSEGQFVQHYQPVVQLADSRIAALEALVRWNHPVHGLRAPDEFLAVADASRVGIALGTWSLKAACEQASALDGGELARVRMAVNLSARQLAEPDLTRLVVSTLEATALEPSRLELEIAEHALANQSADVLERLRELRQLGVRLCLEDFGNGGLSLERLKRLPVDAVKLDRTLVEGIDVDDADERVVAGLIALAHKLGLHTVGEGVERWAQLEILKANDCDLAQGFLFSRPRPAGELIGLPAGDDARRD